MTPDTILHEINKLDTAEKMLLMEKIFDSIGLTSEEMILPQWQREELDQRLAEHRQHQDGDLTSHEFYQQLRNSL
jgi:putative addiction module component (TIGR02574 family)